MDDFLNSVPQELSLGPLGIPGAFDFRPRQVDFQPGDFTIQMAAGAHTNVIDPAATQPPGWYNTPNPPPGFGASIPGSGVGFSTAAALSDDFFNRALAELVRGGGLDFTFSGTIEFGGFPLETNAGDMAFVFPFVGFEKFDPTTPVALEVKPTVSPIVSVGAATGELLEMTVSDLVVDLVAMPSPGHRVSVLRMGISGTVGLDATLDLVAGTLDLLPMTVDAQGYAMNSLPGIDAAPVVSSLGFLLQAILPGLLSSLGSIPIPDISGLGLGVNLEAILGQNDFVYIYTN